ncbi:MAG: SpoIIE family protein phosphatase [bacterium]|nr:SpoIIE family protein phosphatase [bacterium]
MRTLVSILYWLPLLAFQPPPAVRAQQPVIAFQHLSVEDGLPERNVYRIVQDQRGFMWFGTANGVIRYDGYTSTHYKPDPEDPHSLSGRLIISIAEDHTGALWIGTVGGGLNRYDRQLDRFTHYRHDPHDPSSLSVDIVGALHEDHDGVLWVGTGSFEVAGGAGGLHRFDRRSDTFTRFEHDPDDPTSLSPGAVSAILEDSDGALWIATAGGGLNRCDRRIDRCVRLRHDPDDPGTLSDDHLTILHEDRAGRLWVGTWSAGLNRLDRRSGRSTRYRHDPADPGSLSHNRVFAVHEDRDGRLWVGTGNGVLDRFDPAADSFVHFRHDSHDPGSLSDNIAIWSIYEDRTGTLWFAARGSGVDRLDRFASEFIRYAHDPDNPDSLSDNRVKAVLEDRDGVLWVGTRRGGVDRIDPHSGRVTHFRHRPGSPGSLRSDLIFALHRGPSGTLWVGTWAGLSRFDPATESFTHFVHDPDDPTSLSENRVKALIEEASGVLWVGTIGGGLNRLDPSTGKFTHYRHRPGDAGSLGTDIVVALCQDRYGTLWLGGEGFGLQRFHPETESFTRYHYPEIGLDFVTAIHEDRAGRLWVGTFNGGLHLFDRETATRRYFTERDGLPNDGVFHILEDDDGRLWLTTFRGLSVFDPRRELFVNYDHTDGLRADWHTGGAFKGPRGTLYFGGSTGLYAISPGDLVHNPHPPQVVLTDLRIGNQPGEIGPHGPLREHISVAEEIRLRHHENVISLEFAALHYSYPAGNQYAYRMVPFDAGWSWVGPRRWVTYTRLPPGRYTFQVKAASSDGVWNEEGAAVQITIAPPWWRTWWAFAGYVVLLAAALYGTERILHARVVHREREKAKLLEARFRAETAELEVKAAAADTRVLQVEVARQTRELEEARQLQLSMLPAEVPQHPTLAIAAEMSTAAEVGGDYYDFDLADDGTLTVAIGDATGHGSRAGTMVTAAKSLFNFLAREPDVVEALRRSTDAIKRMNLRKLHMALLLAKFKDGRLTLANAGMPPVLIHRAASARVDEIDLAGVPLGSFLSFPYEQETVELEPGDTVIMMSDGFPEMLDPQGEMFGYERLEPLLREVAERSPDEIIRHFFHTAAEWSAGRPQDDDMTFVVMKVKP